MDNAFEEWESIQDRVQNTHFFPLFLDYDGTLVPIVSRPDLAICPPEVRELLENLRDLSNVYLAIISGRALEDIREKIGIPQITYVGNHGLSIQNPAGVHQKRLSPKRQKEFGIINRELRKSLRTIPGVLFENKGLILAVHYRNSGEEDIGLVREVIRGRLQQWNDSWEIAQGKMVIEVRPKIYFHKGKAVLEILRIFPPGGLLPFYFGDDETDEDAFRAMKGRGVTIYVGPGETPSEAEYYLPNPRAVECFLRRCKGLFRMKAKDADAKNIFDILSGVDKNRNQGKPF